MGDLMLGFDCASTAVVAELVLSFSFGPSSSSSAHLDPAGSSDMSGSNADLSFADVEGVSAALLEDVDAKPLAACAYEKGTGFVDNSEFACIGAIVCDEYV